MSDDCRLWKRKIMRSLYIGVVILSAILTACSPDETQPIEIPTLVVLPSPELPAPDATATALQGRMAVEELDRRMTMIGHTPTPTLNDEDFWSTVTAIPGISETVTAMEPTIAAFNTTYWQGFSAQIITGHTPTIPMYAIWRRMTDIPPEVWLTAAAIPPPTLTAYAETQANQP